MKPYPEKIVKAGEESFVWRVAWRVNGVQHRKTFSTQKEAKSWLQSNKKACREKGDVAAAEWNNITMPERHEILEARKNYLEVKASSDPILVKKAEDAEEKKNQDFPPWKKAIEEWVERAGIREQIKFKDAVPKVLEEVKRDSKIESGYAENLEICLKKLSAVFGEKFLHEISWQSILRYFKAQTDWSPGTFNKYHGYFRKIFSWGIENSALTEPNPMNSIRRRSKNKNKIEVPVPCPAVVHEIINTAKEFRAKEMEPYFILSFIFGLRTSEINRLKPEDFSFENGTLRVTAGAAKTSARRVIELKDPIFAYWSNRLQEALSSIDTIVTDNLSDNRAWICAKANFVWNQNMGRHSASTYHYAFYGSAEKSVKFLGHRSSPETFEENYRHIDLVENGMKRAVLPSDAEIFWAVPLPVNITSTGKI